MEKENWKSWNPIQDLPKEIYNDSLIDDTEGLVIIFSDKDNKNRIIVKFENLVLSYRNTDEGSLLKMLNYLNREYGDSFYIGLPFFIVDNSEYIKWFLDQSSGIYQKQDVKHFVFVTPHDVIEVLSKYEPEIFIETIQAK